jgi:O-antigen/teichoic acid export membrane protein
LRVSESESESESARTADTRGLSFLTDTAWTLIASGLVNVFNYGQVVVAGRHLDRSGFGTLGSLVACITISTVFANSFLLEATRRVAETTEARVGALILDLVRNRRRLCIGVVAVTCLASPLVASVLRTSISAVLLALLAVAGLFAGNVALAVTSGLGRLRVQAAVNVTSTMMKFLATLALLLLGAGVHGALAGYVLGYVTIVALTWAWFRLGRRPLRHGTPHASPSLSLSGGARRTSLVSVACYLFSVSPFMVDQILVQALAPALSGDYAALATIGKLVFYASSPVMMVMFPYLLLHADRPAQQWRYLKVGAALTGLAAVATAAVVGLLGPWLSRTLFSSEYTTAITPLIAPFAWSMVAYVFHHVLVLFMIARREWIVLAPLVAIQVGQCLLNALHRDSLSALTVNQMATYGALLLAAVAVAIVRRRTVVPTGALG